VTDHDWESVDHPAADERLVVERGCARCPALAACRTEISWGNGARDATLVVVGEAPAAGDPPDEESETTDDPDPWAGGNHTGLAYTSRHSGRRVRETVAQLGYAGDAYYTNAVNCFPAEGVTVENGTVTGLADDEPTNREPTTAERTACRDHLLTELDVVDPEAVLTTGRHATEAVLAVTDHTVDSFLDVVGEPFDAPTLGVRVVPALHPSYREVWLSRLELSPAAYRDRLRAAIESGGENGCGAR